MVKEESGLQSQKSEASKPNLGLTDRETVKDDYDDFEFTSVKYWARRTCKWFRLGGGIILKSSENHYHVVFDRYVSWIKNIRILAWVAIQTRSIPKLRYLAMQCIKMGSTLRIAPTKDKPSPRLVYRFGCQDHAVKDFLSFRQFIKRIYRSIH